MKRNITLIIIVSLVVLLMIPFLVVSLFISEEEKEKYDFSGLTGRLVYDVEVDKFELVSSNKYAYYLTDTIELSFDDVEKIYDIYEDYEIDYDSDVIDKKIFYNDYIVHVGDYILYFNSTDGVVFQNAEGFQYRKNNKELNEKLLRILSEIKSRKDSVYLFYITDVMSTTIRSSEDISDDDIRLIRQYFNDVKELPEPNNLAIALDYMLVVDDINIYFDDLDGLAMLENKMVVLPENLINILHKYLNIDKKLENDNDNECCSCCPDLKPGESCIALCCPCADNR